MNTYVVLLRGINVGGRNALSMKKLVVLLEDLGYRNVKTYIQSGNVILQSSKNNSHLAERTAYEIERCHGFKPYVLPLKISEFEAAIAANPFPEAEADSKGLHFGFLDTAPSDPDLRELETLKTKSERFRLVNKVFYMHLPDGVRRSKLAANSERLLGVSMTDRNWRTVSKIRDMAEELER
jgi:uncharacterized protein (DUF1697 family)